VGPCALRADRGLLDPNQRDFARPATFARKHVSAALDRAREFHSVSLFAARSGADIFSEARIDVLPNGDIAKALRALQLPEPIGNLISIRQFVLAIRTTAPPASKSWRTGLRSLRDAARFFGRWRS
jgi:hypothetical protein